MADCCCPNPAETSRVFACPLCSGTSSPVNALTVKALLTEAALQRFEPGDYRFCEDTDCAVVYCDRANATFTVEDVRVPVWQKQVPGRRLICYCFGENEADIRTEVEQNGTLGLTLKDVRQLLSDQGRGGRDRCQRVRDLLERRLEDVDAKLAELRSFRQTLRAHLAECNRALDREHPACPVITELAGTTR